VRTAPIYESVAKDSESDCEDGKKLQWALDACAAGDGMVKEAE